MLECRDLGRDSIEQRVALVTGGSRGIGFAVARQFLDEGLAVVITDVSERGLAEARDKLSAEAERTHLSNASVANREAMETVVSEVVGLWGRLDVLVNNAALNRPGGVLTQADSDWDAIIAVNLTGAFIATSVAAAAIKAGGAGGSIVNVGSIGANGFGAAPAYAASKAGLIGLTRQAAVELGPLGITVNLVAPGVTTTEWVEKNLGQARIEASAASAPLRRAGTPEDIASVVCYLASPGARHVTGQVVSVSGGVWMP